MPTDDANAVPLALLDAFADAWNRHDTDAILSMMTEDCIFEASRGPDVKGTAHTGQDEVRGGVDEVFATFPTRSGMDPGTLSPGIVVSRSGCLQRPAQMVPV
jgi:ketosteroid isomerase-like protein